VDVIKVLLREAPDAWRRALVVAGLAGLGNAAILAVINRGAALASSDLNLVNVRLLALFGLCMLAFFAGKRYALIQASVIVEHMVKDRLVRVTDKIRLSDLELVENLGRGELFTKISQDTSLISQSGLILVNAAQQFLVLVFCLGYIAWLSTAAFLTTILTIGIGSAVYFQHANSSQILLTRLNHQESALVDMLGHMVDGFKEIRLNCRKSDAVFRSFNDIANNVRDLKIDTQINFCVDIMFSDIVFYSLLASVVFVLPRLIPTYGTVVLMITSAILFITGPLQLVVQSAPVFQRAKAALANLGELEDRLDRGLEGRPMYSRTVDYRNFQSIAFEGAFFTYAARENSNGSFSVGPLNLQIRRGETVFLVGGNGSGKTTVMKLLTGLYFPQHGALTGC
jgi:putative pyoverdin transport system ATP-binding/permease protein